MGDAAAKLFGLGPDALTRTEDSVAGVVAAVRLSLLWFFFFFPSVSVHLTEARG